MDRHVKRVHTKGNGSAGRHGLSGGMGFIAAGASSINSFDFGCRRKVNTDFVEAPKMKQFSRQCRFCRNTSIPGSDLCYSCE